MRYFAKIENDSLVSQVIVIADDVESPEDFIAELGIDGKWIESFEDGGARVNMAAVGYTYDANRDMFIQNKPEGIDHIDFILDEALGRWIPELSEEVNG
jgi:hypothetical protein